MKVDNAANGIAANGIDDDGPGLRAALENLRAAGHDSAELGPGRYLLGRDGGQTHCLEIPISLVGAGVERTTLAFTDQATNAKGVAIYVSGVQLAGMTLDGQWGGSCDGTPNRHNVFVGKNARGTCLRDLESVNADGDGLYIHDSAETMIEGLGARLVCRGNRRNSVTLGSRCDGLIMRHIELDQCGTQHIDAEPQIDGRTCDHVQILDVRFGACGGDSITTPGPSFREFNRDWRIERCYFASNAGGVQVRWVDGIVLDRLHFDPPEVGGRVDVYVRRASDAVRVTGCTFKTKGTGVLIRGNTKTSHDVPRRVTLSGNSYHMLPGARRAVECGDLDSLIMMGEQVYRDDQCGADAPPAVGLAIYPKSGIREILARANVIQADTALQLGWPGFAGVVQHADINGNVLRGAVNVRSANFGGGSVQQRTPEPFDEGVEA